jgi:hypothetical protein
MHVIRRNAGETSGVKIADDCPLTSRHACYRSQRISFPHADVHKRRALEVALIDILIHKTDVLGTSTKTGVGFSARPPGYPGCWLTPNINCHAFSLTLTDLNLPSTLVAKPTCTTLQLNVTLIQSEELSLETASTPGIAISKPIASKSHCDAAAAQAATAATATTATAAVALTWPLLFHPTVHFPPLTTVVPISFFLGYFHS